MRGTVANVLRFGVMAAMLALGVVIVTNRAAEPEPEPEPPTRTWNALAPVVRQVERARPGAWSPPERRLAVAGAGGPRDVVVAGVRGDAEVVDAHTARWRVDATDVATHAPLVLVYTVVDGSVTEVRVDETVTAPR